MNQIIKKAVFVPAKLPGCKPYIASKSVLQDHSRLNIPFKSSNASSLLRQSQSFFAGAYCLLCRPFIVMSSTIATTS